MTHDENGTHCAYYQRVDSHDGWCCNHSDEFALADFHGVGSSRAGWCCQDCGVVALAAGGGRPYSSAMDNTPNPNLSQSAAEGTMLRWWLIVVAAMIVAMVVVGGATRLTGSGLSITEWQPIMGALPPFNDADWQLLFQKYQQSSQFKLQNSGMTIEDFKSIFWWEWSHRLLGRTVGAVFFVPFIGFLIAGKIERRLMPRLFLIFILGGLQGALGWYMVASGLVDRVEVSQYRLSAHLTLATILLGAVVWTIFSIKSRHTRPRDAHQWVALGLAALVLLQVAAGAFVAGLNAGLAYNTWPLMDGHFIPNGLLIMEPPWRNIFENALTVQFDHRMLAYLILAGALWHGWRSSSASSLILVAAVLAQVGLGITTLLAYVPLDLALTHQFGAMVVLIVALWNLHRHTVVQV
jgi:cytochrome c oxidase assembly protein subunit 15